MALHKRNLWWIVSEDKRKGKNTEFAFHFLSSTIFFRKKKRKVYCNKFSAKKAPITPEMRAETHVHVVIKDKCVFFDNLIKTEMRRPILVELPRYTFVYMRLVWVKLKSL